MNIVLQLIVAVLVVITAGLKSLRFASSRLTEFELDRRSKEGDQEAQREHTSRSMRPYLDALRRLAVLLCTLLIITVLAIGYPVVLVIIFAFVWLFTAEVLSARHAFIHMVEQVALRHESLCIRLAQTLHPILQVMAQDQTIGGGLRSVFYSKQELQQAIDQDAHVLNKEEKLLIRQALSYSDMRVKDIMTPRSVVVTIEGNDTIGPLLLDKLHKAGYSRYPVTDGDLDHIQGVLYAHDLIPLNPKHKTVSDAMDRRVYYVHQDKSLDHVLEAFLRTRHHLFMVTNEFEEVTGVVSIEDVIEAIIGRKIVDEFDQYEDLRAVARLVANERRKVRKPQGD